MQGLVDNMSRWMALIDAGDMEAGPVFRHELAGALTVLEVALGHDPSLVEGLLFTDDESLQMTNAQRQVHQRACAALLTAPVPGVRS
jgi:hypothetical protein